VSDCTVNGPTAHAPGPNSRLSSRHRVRRLSVRAACRKTRDSTRLVPSRLDPGEHDVCPCKQLRNRGRRVGETLRIYYRRRTWPDDADHGRHAVRFDQLDRELIMVDLARGQGCGGMLGQRRTPVPSRSRGAVESRTGTAYVMDPQGLTPRVVSSADSARSLHGARSEGSECASD
jgi:hypothetical protein